MLRLFCLLDYLLVSDDRCYLHWCLFCLLVWLVGLAVCFVFDLLFCFVVLFCGLLVLLFCFLFAFVLVLLVHCSRFGLCLLLFTCLFGWC